MRGKPFRPGESGNPAGKPPGTGKIEPLRAAIREHVPEIIKAMVTQAKAGDVGAAKLLLERTLPPVKPVQEPAPVALEGATLTEKAGSILDAVSTGRLSVSDAKALLEALAAVAKIAEVDELTRRIEVLETTHERTASGPD